MMKPNCPTCAKRNRMAYSGWLGAYVLRKGGWWFTDRANKRAKSVHEWLCGRCDELIAADEGGAFMWREPYTPDYLR